MNITPIGTNLNFGRAFTTEEKKAYNNLIKDAKDALEIKDTTAIVFDFNVPSEKDYNTSIGTTFSDSMKKFTAFVTSMVGVNSLQLQPQGKIIPSNTSPYSGTNFAIGEHIIDLKKLSTKEYAKILSPKSIRKIDEAYIGDKNTREYRTNYEYVIGKHQNDGIQEKLLRAAFVNFHAKIESEDKYALKLNKEFDLFKSENISWLEKNALFQALSIEYGIDDINKWSSFDKNLFAKLTPLEERNERIKYLKENYSDVMEFENFKQFIASKQQKESRGFLNSKNLKLYGDCLIGFSRSEMWANIDCFRENLYYGGPDPGCPETNNIQTWSLPALDYTKLGKCDNEDDLSQLGEVGKFLYDKYKTFFQRYDGVRVDAAWQFVTPFIYQELNGNFEEVEMPAINMTIFNIMNAAAKDVLGDKYDEHFKDNVMLEMVGISAGRAREITLNQYPHLYTTAYAEYDETPAKFLQKGYQNGSFYVGVGCHDNESLVNMAKDHYKRNLHMEGIRRDYSLDESMLPFENERYLSQTKEQKIEENFRTAKFSEIFTTAKQFFTLPDMFGMSERINVSGKVDNTNWTVRIPSNYERFYFSQLANGYGLNLPKVLANSMRMNGIKDNALISKCNEAAEILRSDGPMTEKEANIAKENNQLNRTFEYIS